MGDASDDGDDYDDDDDMGVARIFGEGGWWKFFTSKSKINHFRWVPLSMHIPIYP